MSAGWKRGLALAGVAVLGFATLVGCGGGGGGGGGGDPPAAATDLPAGRSFTPGSTTGPLATVVSISQVNKTTVGTDTVQYEFRVTIRGGSQSLRAVEATLSAAGSGTTVVNGSITVPELAANQALVPNATVTLTHKGPSAFDSSALVWRVRAILDQPPLGRGVVLLDGALGRVAIGETLSASVRLAPTDARNPLTRLQIANATPGGAVPSIGLDGSVTWTPNAQDFATTSLSVAAEQRDGSTTSFQVSVTVTKYRTVAQIALFGPGRYSDPSGRYILQVDSDNSVATGTLVIAENYDATGAYTYLFSVPSRSIRVRAIRAPVVAPHAAVATGSATKMSRADQRLLASGVDTIVPVIGQKLDTRTNVYTTRQDVYLREEGVAFLPSIQQKRPDAAAVIGHYYGAYEVARVEANCNYRKSGYCAGLVGIPVILIHGFTPEATIDLGGGESTWGTLAETLKGRGHPVIEMRWMTQMRFEEAAGILAKLGAEVASGTGRRPLIIAHSFGGVVAHLTLAGKGIAWNPARSAWEVVPVGTRDEPVFEGLVTLASPLSGINEDGDRTDLVKGRYDLDLTINVCQSITCAQAGAFDMGVLPDLQKNAGLLLRTDGVRPTVASDTYLKVGESIEKIRTAWKANAIALPTAKIHTVVAIRERPFDDFTPNLTEETAYKLGDGLISLVGQAVVTSDFLCIDNIPRNTRYLIQACLDQQVVGGLFRRLDQPPAEGADDSLLHVTLPHSGRRYHFATRARHTGLQVAPRIDRYETRPYPIAKYPDEGDVIVGEDWKGSDYKASHPLRYFMDHVLKREVTPEPGNSTFALVQGNVAVAGQSPTVAQLTVTRSIVSHDTGTEVRPASTVELTGAGAFAFDAAAWIRAEIGSSAVLSDFRVRITVSDPKGSRIYDTSVDTRRLSDASRVETLGQITVYPRSGIALVTVFGTVRDSAFGGAQSFADVWIARGTNLTNGEVRATPESQAARRVRADSGGFFRIDGLLPGDYTVHASGALRAGKIDRLTVNGSISFDIHLTETFARYSGSNAACFVSISGALKCWGGNEEGQVGDGSLTTRLIPTAVVGMQSAVSNWSIGDRHTCAAKNDSSVWCWGANYSGQLGDGTTSRRTSPVRVQGLDGGAAQVVAGDRHSCALTTGGGVMCWGDNSYGQLGDATTNSRSTPAYVPGLRTGVISISAGWWFTCALTASNGVWCWGDNWAGQLGNGTLTSSLVPVAVQGLGTDVVRISSGGWHQCATTRLGSAYCWGYNLTGQLGDGTTSDQRYPVLVTGGSGIRELVAGNRHTCVLQTSGAVRCWGENAYGQVGDGSSVSYRSTPVLVTGLQSGVEAIAARGLQTTVRLTNGTFWGWGGNASGQVGDGTLTDRRTPVSISWLNP